MGPYGGRLLCGPLDRRLHPGGRRHDDASTGAAVQRAARHGAGADTRPARAPALRPVRAWRRRGVPAAPLPECRAVVRTALRRHGLGGRGATADRVRQGQVPRPAHRGHHRAGPSALPADPRASRCVARRATDFHGRARRAVHAPRQRRLHRYRRDTRGLVGVHASPVRRPSSGRDPRREVRRPIAACPGRTIEHPSTVHWLLARHRPHEPRSRGDAGQGCRPPSRCGHPARQHGGGPPRSPDHVAGRALGHQAGAAGADAGRQRCAARTGRAWRVPVPNRGTRHAGRTHDGQCPRWRPRPTTSRCSD